MFLLYFYIIISTRSYIVDIDACFDKNIANHSDLYLGDDVKSGAKANARHDRLRADMG